MSTPWTLTAPSAESGVDVLLADGRVARIRPVVAGDLPALVRLHQEAGDESLRRRFFSVNRTIGRTYAEHLCGDAPGTIALAAFVGEELLAVASAEVEPGGTAEVAFLVADRAHGLGLGTLLVEHLAAAARERHVHAFTAEVLADNTAMLRVFTDCGFDVRHTSAAGVQDLVLDIAATARAVAAADLRECRAEARSLAPLLHPKSVAIVGVRRDGTGVGAAVLESVLAGGFAGDVYVVHPTLPPRDGVRVLTGFDELEGGVDLVVIAVPAREVTVVAEAAARAGARCAVVVSSGFAELGEDGAMLQRELVRIGRQHSMRVVGPNCLGVVANDPDLRLDATFAVDVLPPAGGLALASQSGGVGVALLDRARRLGVGVASFVSLGNKADVSGNDLLAAWLEDDQVTAAALYLESFGNARKFARLAHRFAERKPLLAVMGGRSSGGRRAGASHTAAAAASGVGVDALFRQAGVIPCTGVDALMSTAQLLGDQPLPAGPRLGIVGNAGGLGILAADAASEAGLVVPELSAELRARLLGHAAATSAVSNPIDLGAVPDAEAMLAATRAVLHSDEVDAVLVIVVGTGASGIGSFLAPLERDRPAGKPLLLVTLGRVEVPDHGFCRFDSVDEAAAALGRVATYAAWRTSTGCDEPPVDPPASDEIRALAGADHLVAPSWLPPSTIGELLGAYGLRLPKATVVHGVAEAVVAAGRTGYPVVVKSADPAVVHKTDRGLVVLDVDGPAAVHRAVARIGAELGDPLTPLLVQEQVADGVEMVVGVVRDPTLGPMVMVGAGGVTTDVLADRVFLLPPFTAGDALRGLRTLRCWSLLAGFRGAPPVDAAALAKVVVSVGDLALQVPEVAELDLNPVVCTPSAATCVDARIRLAPPVGPPDAGVPRRLRSPV